MDLSTTYAGLSLKHPLIMGASPLVDDLDAVRRAEDAGVAAVIMHSLFEEQIRLEQSTLERVRSHGESFAEAASYMPTPSDFVLGPDAYLEQIRKVKERVSVPVFGSLNGLTNFGWVDYARRIQQAGADGLELNVYSVAHDPTQSAADVEDDTVEIVRSVVNGVKIPVMVKLSPFYTSLAHFAQRLEEAGATGLVLFNRFYQPDIDVEGLDVLLKLELSSPSELLLRLRWTAILSGRLRMTLGVSGGVHSGLDAVKAVMAGAHGVQLVSALLKNGPEHIAKLRDDMGRWLEEHEYSSLRQAHGSMNLSRSPSPMMFERANYVKILQGYARSLL